MRAAFTLSAARTAEEAMLSRVWRYRLVLSMRDRFSELLGRLIASKVSNAAKLSADMFDRNPGSSAVDSVASCFPPRVCCVTKRSSDQ